MDDILVIVENNDLRKSICHTMMLVGYRISEANDSQSGLDRFKQTSFDVVILKLQSPNIDGLGLIKKVKRINSSTSLIGIADKESSGDIATAISEGAYAILHTPVNMEELQIQVKKALIHTSLIQEVAYLRHARPNVVYNFDNILSKSDKIREIFSVLRNIAKTDTPVTIYGESGTGKELISGAIHYNSLRKNKNFIKVNCAALPGKYLESELFGHKAGAFKGADNQRVGRLEQANHGTLFLEEISVLTLPTQAKLIRFIQKKEIQRLGTSQTIKLDVRLIFSTKRNLNNEIRAGRFREDLFWKFSMVPIELPPLRQRVCDIPILSEYFLKYYNKEFSKNIGDFDAKTKNMMLKYKWPGNIRELRKAVEWAVLKTEQDIITLKDMGFLLSGSHDTPSITEDELSLVKVEKNTILKALRTTNWVQKDAATLLGISKRALNYKIEQLQIKNPKWFKNK